MTQKMRTDGLGHGLGQQLDAPDAPVRKMRELPA